MQYLLPIKGVIIWLVLLGFGTVGGVWYASLHLPLIYFTLLLVIICAITDYFTGLIYNIVVMPAVAFALSFYAATAGTSGLLGCLKGLIITLCLAFFMYWFCALGGGDFKLVFALGALHGGTFAGLSVMIASLFMGFYGIITMFRKGKLKEFMTQVAYTSKYVAARISSGNNSKVETWELPESEWIPYGVPLAIAVWLLFLLDFV
ncbi:prepilin peptidase [Desulforamulus aquiferis]|uniref:Prepilin type IV endopeptidase peptidase domain-containing protein n=1 Tax=Desulforamulus aquiferis TaxID=1397668 RepID=A0AAW7ZAD4_9FIRM|nr:prepilin peptidase [Desulforamulus aquiferis]MDO7785805.1 hypothetical protein [Desulforamulus aquiferis]